MSESIDLMAMAAEAHSETDKKERITFPDFPGEEPSKRALQRWLDTWDDDLNSSGYAAIMRGELPFDVAKLKEVP